MRNTSRAVINLLATVSLISVTMGCSTVVSSVTNQLAVDLSKAVLSNPDQRVVSDGLPAYLILIDALIEGNPADAEMLRTAAMLNGSYASAFVEDPIRRKQLADKAKRLALNATCAYRETLCNLQTLKYDAFTQSVQQSSAKDIDYVYVLGTSWAGWIQAHSDDFFAIAELPRAKALIERVIELDSTYADGSPHLYLGVFALTLPAALGGQPEFGREQFERAIELSQGRNLYAKVLLAEMYARSTFNRDLHDHLIDEVLSADPLADDFTLQNVVAQDLAQQLKESADEFF